MRTSPCRVSSTMDFTFGYDASVLCTASPMNSTLCPPRVSSSMPRSETKKMPMFVAHVGHEVAPTSTASLRGVPSPPDEPLSEGGSPFRACAPERVRAYSVPSCASSAVMRSGRETIKTGLNQTASPETYWLEYQRSEPLAPTSMPLKLRTKL